PPVALAPGASTTLTVTYTPHTTGNETATVTVNHTGTNAVTIPLTGTGTTPPPPATIAVNAGGPAVSGTPAWSADTAAAPSQYVNAAATGNNTYTTNQSVNMTDPSVPAGTPMSIFQSERWDPPGGAEMTWTFPATAGQYQVRLYFAEIYFTQPGQRTFNVTINGTQVLTNYDTVADVGPFKAVTKTFTTTTTTTNPNITIVFGHATENPNIKAIQITPVTTTGTPNQLGAAPTSVAFGSVNQNNTVSQPVTLTNLGGTSDPTITVNSATVTGTNAADFTATLTNPPVALAPGASTTLTVTYTPHTTGNETATVTVNHTGTNAVTIPLTGTGTTPPPPATIAVNAGGPAVSGTPAWSADTAAAPSQYVNAAATGNNTYTTNQSVNMTDPSVPAGTPMSIFQSERWDPPGGAEMTWTFPATAGQYQVRLYFAEIYFTQPGQRTFNVTINGTQVLTNYDTVADVGPFKAVTKTFTTTTTTTNPNITIVFGHATENPNIKAIQITPVTTTGTPNQLGAAPTSVAFGSVNQNNTVSQPVTLTNLGGTSDPTITVNSATVTGTNAADFTATLTNPPVALAPGASTTLTVTYTPHTTGNETATVTVNHTGTNAVTIPLTGTGTTPPPPATIAVNAGGPAVSGTPAWSADTAAAPSQYVNAAATGNNTYTTNQSVNMTDPSVPAGTPMSIFQSERWDPPGGAEMTWTFPATAGQYQVRLYFAEIYFTQPGQRTFNVTINGTQVLTNYDTVADVGPFKAVTKTFTTTTTTTNPNITIVFGHATENPNIKAIQIAPVTTQPNKLGVSASAIDFGARQTGQPSTIPLTLTNLGGAGDPNITVTSLATSGTDAAQFSGQVQRYDANGHVNTAQSVTIPPGGSATVNAWFAPATGARSATLTIGSTAANSSVPVALTGSGSANVIGFGKSVLAGTASGVNTDVVKFGPDGRLYVAEFSGLIHAYTVVRSGANNYAVTATETINLIQQIPNHDDDGTLDPSVTTRIITGMLVVGTASNPQLYVSSSDPRIGGGANATQTNVDTNSSMLSRLDRVNGTWTRTDLVRGLPRSEENHSANGMALDPATNMLYMGQGGNTNMGGPSHNFNLLPEYAYSAAILKIDLNAIGNTTYDLPTLSDDNLPNLTGPFGGDQGRHQAKIVAGSPVQVYAPGFRNPYDVVITRAGRMYTIDNGANAGWGDIPIGNGPNGTCTNAESEPGVTDVDALHLITGPGYYGGHPNPTRGNTANTFNTTHPQSPVLAADPVECNYLKPGTSANPGLTTFDTSSNGLVEYTATNFGGALDGHLLVAGWDGNVFDVQLDPNTGAVVSNQTLFANLATNPLSLTTQGNTGAFPGVVFVADYATGKIDVLEPNDFGGAVANCTGVSSTSDEDGDGY